MINLSRVAQRPPEPRQEPTPEPHGCPLCGEEFEPINKRRRFCCEQHRKTYHRIRAEQKRKRGK